MAESKYLPNRGDVIWINLDPRVGHEQSGRRPAIVLSDRLMAESVGLAIVAPITSKVKNLPFEILVKGKRIDGAILPFQIRTVDIVARQAAFIEKADEDIIDLTTNTIKNLIS